MNKKVVCLRLVILFGLCAHLKGQEVPIISQQNQEDSKVTVDQLLGLKNIARLETNIHSSQKKEPVDRFASIQANPLTQMGHQKVVLNWEAAKICYHPLFFEDTGLERYAQDAGLLQPMFSGAHFFGRLGTWPLHAMAKRPFSCEFPLGHYRPGDCTPYLHYSWPW